MNYIAVGMIVAVGVACGMFILFTNDTVGEIDNYCQMNRFGQVADVNCTIWNNYRDAEYKMLMDNYDVYEYCELNGNNSGSGVCADYGLSCVWFTCNRIKVNAKDLFM